MAFAVHSCVSVSVLFVCVLEIFLKMSIIYFNINLCVTCAYLGWLHPEMAGCVCLISYIYITYNPLNLWDNVACVKA